MYSNPYSISSHLSKSCHILQHVNLKIPKWILTSCSYSDRDHYKALVDLENLADNSFILIVSQKPLQLFSICETFTQE